MSGDLALGEKSDFDFPSKSLESCRASLSRSFPRVGGLVESRAEA